MSVNVVLFGGVSNHLATQGKVKKPYFEHNSSGDNKRTKNLVAKMLRLPPRKAGAPLCGGITLCPLIEKRTGYTDITH